MQSRPSPHQSPSEQSSEGIPIIFEEGFREGTYFPNEMVNISVGDRPSLLRPSDTYSLLKQALEDVGELPYVHEWCGGTVPPVVVGMVAAGEGEKYTHVILRHPDENSDMPVMVVCMGVSVRDGDVSRRVFLFDRDPEQSVLPFYEVNDDGSTAAVPYLQIMYRGATRNRGEHVSVYIPPTRQRWEREVNSPVNVAYMPRQNSQSLSARSMYHGRRLGGTAA